MRSSQYNSSISHTLINAKLLLKPSFITSKCHAFCCCDQNTGFPVTGEILNILFLFSVTHILQYLWNPYINNRYINNNYLLNNYQSNHHPQHNKFKNFLYQLCYSTRTGQFCYSILFTLSLLTKLFNKLNVKQ